jgi:hypothetical protein
VVLRFRLRFTSAFVRLRRDKSARQGCLRIHPRHAAFPATNGPNIETSGFDIFGLVSA